MITSCPPYLNCIAFALICIGCVCAGITIGLLWRPRKNKVHDLLDGFEETCQEVYDKVYIHNTSPSRRFTNTMIDLQDCFDHLSDNLCLDWEEENARELLVKTCKDIVHLWEDDED